MVRGAVRAVVTGAATAAVASCGGGGANGNATPRATATPTLPAVVTPATVPPHDLAVALRKVLTQGSAELAATRSDLQAAATLDQAAQTMGNHAAVFETLHQTLEQLPAFPVPQTQADVHRLSVDLDGLSSVISAMIAAEVSQYGQYKGQINARMPVVSADITAVGDDLKGF
jgi:hypothetical protein